MFNLKEDLLKYLLKGYIHVSKKDYSFFNNLIHIIDQKNTLTTNQSILFDKLLNKYQRQLKKENHNLDHLLNLKWDSTIVESKKEFLQAYLSLENGQLIIKSPFNSKFIQDLRRLKYNAYVWDKSKKIYTAPFSTISLKHAVELITKHFKNYSFCDEITNLLNHISEYKNIKYWYPTLIKRHDNFYIVGSNPYVLEAISHIDLNDNPETLFQLCQYGIAIDEAITQDPLLKFASQFSSTIDLDQTDLLCEWLKALKIDTVITSRDIIYNKNISNEVKMKLSDSGISHLPANEMNTERPYVLIKTFSSMVPFHKTNDKNIVKVISLTNSRAIDIR